MLVLVTVVSHITSKHITWRHWAPSLGVNAKPTTVGHWSAAVSYVMAVLNL